MFVSQMSASSKSETENLTFLCSKSDSVYNLGYFSQKQVTESGHVFLRSGADCVSFEQMSADYHQQASAVNKNGNQ
ncbi:hypothetical protein F2P81_004359 [Scophthalmus maximus]|uniref:Uncharacterized protein n=1 Tax=Scophthalmus maximus TaxID=52904 RepID=A0A6A4TLZ9_SCOMX|nr:hypothetical protein F2P81_004359 [Scophthalmus maximus]